VRIDSPHPLVCSITDIRYMVVVKTGKPTERTRPGNRGKRDSQILLLHYLNRVHFDAPMSPLELEIYHQMRNVIGIDPAFYEYIFTVDADTVRSQSAHLDFEC
jgi:chitin synthase